MTRTDGNGPVPIRGGPENGLPGIGLSVGIRLYKIDWEKKKHAAVPGRCRRRPGPNAKNNILHRCTTWPSLRAFLRPGKCLRTARRRVLPRPSPFFRRPVSAGCASYGPFEQLPRFSMFDNGKFQYCTLFNDITPGILSSGRCAVIPSCRSFLIFLTDAYTFVFFCGHTFTPAVTISIISKK